MGSGQDEAVVDRSLVLYLIVCGAPPAGHDELAGLIRRCQANGWDVCLVGSRIGRRFLDVHMLEELTGHPVREDYKQPDEPDVLPPPDAMVCAPATFNTINKLAAGISDTLPLGMLNEAIGAGLPVIVAPWTNKPLVGHPAFGRSVESVSSHNPGHDRASPRYPTPHPREPRELRPVGRLVGKRTDPTLDHPT
jgi:hypothetical protein